MILQVQNGCFGYPGQPAILENIDLTLEEGHILATLGPNGIGKTTLLKCMIGLSKIVMSIGMLVGRLEFYPILILFSPYAWKRT